MGCKDMTFNAKTNTSSPSSAPICLRSDVSRQRNEGEGVRTLDSLELEFLCRPEFKAENGFSLRWCSCQNSLGSLGHPALPATKPEKKWMLMEHGWMDRFGRCHLQTKKQNKPINLKKKTKNRTLKPQKNPSLSSKCFLLCRRRLTWEDISEKLKKMGQFFPLGVSFSRTPLAANEYNSDKYVHTDTYTIKRAVILKVMWKEKSLMCFDPPGAAGLGAVRGSSASSLLHS